MMMTDKQRIERMQAKLNTNVYFRNNVLSDLLDFIDETTGNLSGELCIPQKERDCEYLEEVIKELGYQAEYDEEYNPHYKCLCSKITNLRRDHIS